MKDCQGFPEQVNCWFLLGRLIQEIQQSHIWSPISWLNSKSTKVVICLNIPLTKVPASELAAHNGNKDEVYVVVINIAQHEAIGCLEVDSFWNKYCPSP